VFPGTRVENHCFKASIGQKKLIEMIGNALVVTVVRIVLTIH